MAVHHLPLATLEASYAIQIRLKWMKKHPDCTVVQWPRINEFSWSQVPTVISSAFLWPPTYIQQCTCTIAGTTRSKVNVYKLKIVLQLIRKSFCPHGERQCRSREGDGKPPPSSAIPPCHWWRKKSQRKTFNEMMLLQHLTLKTNGHLH